tara:strand:+ start:2590 stop:3639 length:1050 start_codon:yes stop_codon:yes gene_type:complete
MFRKIQVSLLLISSSFGLLSQSCKDFVEDSSMYSVSMIYDDIVSLMYTYSDLLTVDILGRSEFGQAIPIMTIENKAGNNMKKPVLLVGNLHAREFFSSKFVMKFTNQFLLSLNNSNCIYKDVSRFLDEYVFYIVPLANPDGLKIAQEDWKGIEEHRAAINKIKRIGPFSDWKANGKGIDLNNNFDDGNFHLKHGRLFEENPASQGHKGAFPGEAVEARLIQNLIDSIHPFITLSFHTKGDILFWADRGTHAKFKGLDTKLNTRVSKECGLLMARVSENPKDYAAGLENYVRAKTGTIGVCVELSKPNNKDAQHPPDQFHKLVWEKCKYLPFIYLDEFSKLYPEYQELFE